MQTRKKSFHILNSLNEQTVGVEGNALIRPKNYICGTKLSIGRYCRSPQKCRLQEMLYQCKSLVPVMVSSTGIDFHFFFCG